MRREGSALLMLMPTRKSICTMALLLTGCSGSSLPLVIDAGHGMDAGAMDGGAADAGPVDAAVEYDAQVFQTPTGDGGTCTTTIQQFATAPGVHVPVCSPLTYPTNPPTSGPHYPVWAAYDATYTAPIPHGYLVHNLEHGSIVIGYNCPAGCDAQVAQLEAYLATRPKDLLCAASIRERVIVAPDPDLNVRFAAAAWGWALKSDCFDLTQLAAFMDAHYAKAPENTCADGTPTPTCP